MRTIMSFALRSNGHVIHSVNSKRFEGVNMAESIRKVMTSNPRSLESGSSAVEAAQLMRDEDVGIVPIVEGEKLVGTVTDRDIVTRVVAEGKTPESVTVGEIASRELVTIDPQQDLDDALRLMARHQVRRLPVVEEDGKLVGIVAQRDVAMHASEAQTGEVVEDISR
jgi:CBS domain-containing protein